jgi:hypothetical protein
MQPIETTAEISTKKKDLGHQERALAPASEPRTIQVARINADWALSSDGLQWILQRRSGVDKRTGQEVWAHLSFVSSTKDILARCMREKGVPAEDAQRVLDSLPDAFPDGQAGTVHALHAAPGPRVRRSATKALPPGIVPDATYPGMYRLVLADGSLSDMVNLTRAKDALRYLTQPSRN